MNKENIKILLQVYKNLGDKLYDFVEEEVKEQFIENYLGGSFQGWRHDIELHVDGSLFLTGALGPITSLQSNYEGNSITLASIQAWYEIEQKIEKSDVDCLTEEEQKELYNRVIYEACIGEEEFNNIYDLLILDNWEYNVVIEEKFKELFPEKYEELMKCNAEFEWDYYVRDEILNTIDERIEELRESI